MKKSAEKKSKFNPHLAAFLVPIVLGEAVEDSEVVLGHSRETRPSGVCWEIIGGLANKGESVLQALWGEVYEESTLTKQDWARMSDHLDPILPPTIIVDFMHKGFVREINFYPLQVASSDRSRLLRKLSKASKTLNDENWPPPTALRRPHCKYRPENDPSYKEIDKLKLFKLDALPEKTSIANAGIIYRVAKRLWDFEHYLSDMQEDRITIKDRTLKETLLTYASKKRPQRLAAIQEATQRYNNATISDLFIRINS